MATGPQGNQGQARFDRERLMAMFRACSRDPTEAIKTRLRRMLTTFLQHYRGNAGNENTNDLAVQFQKAVIWYYRILEKLVSQERNRLETSDLSVILDIELFQSCLVACCLEITTSTSLLKCDFPLLLQIFNLAPYHFMKVIELVLRAEVGMPRAAFRHLAEVEKKVLESLAWTSDSPLWEEIRANEGHLPTCQQVMPPTQLEGPQTDSQPDRNQPGDLGLGAEPSTSTDQQNSPSAVNRPRRRNSLQLFAAKIYSLMGKRLRDMCLILVISDELRLKIWTCFEHSLVHRTDLMVDHHLDQLLMCSIYIMAKITGVELPFKRIMQCYRAQPFARKNVCKNVLISGRETENTHIGNNNGDHGVSSPTPNTPSTHYPEPGHEERGNLIHFYNQIYTPRIQDFAKQFVPTFIGDTPPLSPYPQQRKASPRKRQLSSSPSINISPYDPETSPPTRPGLSYFFNSRGSSERLREINNMIRMGRSPNIQGYALPLDREEEQEEGEGEEDGPSAKRLRLAGQSALERRLNDVVNDRITRGDRDRDQDQDQDQDQPSSSYKA